MQASAQLFRPFYSPARVLEGADSRRRLAQELCTVARSEDVLLVADGAIHDLGVVDEAASLLTDGGLRAKVAMPVAREPTVQTVATLLEAVPASGVGAVVGIGGGSAMDAAKLAAVSLTRDVDLSLPLASYEISIAAPPLALVPTTAGTGAEATNVAMLWEGQRKRIHAHPTLVPQLVVLDPFLTMSLPPAVTASSGLDAVSHAVESLLSTYRTPLTMLQAVAAFKELAENLSDAYTAGSPEARDGMLRGAFRAGLALNASVVVGHSLAYAIAARARLPHGVACALVLPYCIAYYAPIADALLRPLLPLVGVGDAAGLAHWLAGLATSMEIPSSLAAVGIRVEAAERIATECLDTYPRPNSPLCVTRERLERLLSYAMAGDLGGALSAMAEKETT
jgi:alcohol dehydrogenase class IV